MKKLKTKSILACAVLASVLAGGFGLGMGRAEAADETPVFKVKVNDVAEKIWDGKSDLCLLDSKYLNPHVGNAKFEVWGEGATTGNTIYASYNGADLSDLTITLNSGTVAAVFGSKDTNGQLNGETVIINGGTVTGGSHSASVCGGYNSGNGSVSNGVVKINGGTFNKIVSGGYVSGSGYATGNELDITGGTFRDGGGYVNVIGGHSGGNAVSGGDASDNKVNISGGYGKEVFGGEGGKNANNNEVNISGGEYEIVWGGRGSYGDAKDNIVRISGGKISVRSGGNQTKVVGGWAGNGEVSGNQVILSGGDLSKANVYGWYYANTHSDNTLQIENSVSVSSVKHFENLNFVLPQNIEDGATMLTLSNGVDLGDVAVNVYLNGKEHGTITLIDGFTGTFGTITSNVYTGTVEDSTLSNGYTITLSNNQLVLTNDALAMWYKVGTEENWILKDAEAQSISDVNDDVTIYRGAAADNAYNDINAGSHKLTVAGDDDVNSIKVTGNLTAGPLEIKDGKSLKVDGNIEVGQVALGTGSTIVAARDFVTENILSIGRNNTIGAVNTVALGSNVVVSGENSVAIGNNSVASEANTVSVGRPALDTGTYADETNTAINRRIVNVASGTADTDAATYGQVKNAVKGLSYDSNTKKISFTTVGNGTTQYLDLSSLGGTGGLNYVAATPYNSPNDSASAMAQQYDGGGGATALGYNSKADAAFATALGWGAQATGLGATAIGSNSVATRAHALAVGDESKAEGENSTALGYMNEVNLGNSAAVGNHNVVAGSEGAAFGAGNNITGLTGIALGSKNVVSGDYAITLGSNSKAQEDYSVAVGSYALANGVESMALGRDSQTGSSAVGAMAFGSSARATGASALAAGSFSESAKRDYAVEYCKELIKRVVTEPPEQGTAFEKTIRAITGDNYEEWLAKDTDTFINDLENALPGGLSFKNAVMPVVAGNEDGNMDGTTASGLNAIAIGASTKPQGNMASGANSIAIGTDAQATAIGSVAIGANSVATETNTVSVGNSTVQRRIVNVAAGTADTDAATVAQAYSLWTIGNNNGSVRMTGGNNVVGSNTEYALAMGLMSSAEGNYSLAAGYNAKTSGGASVAIGAGTVTNGYAAVSLGQDTVANTNAVALGYKTKAEGKGATATGYGSEAYGEGSFAGGGHVTNTQVVGGKAYGESSFAFGTGAVAGSVSYAPEDTQQEHPIYGGNYTFAFGNNALASKDNAIALGSGAKAEHANSVAIGSNSVTVADNTVAIGDVSNSVLRRITGLADGVDVTDAATVAQAYSLWSAGTGEGSVKMTAGNNAASGEKSVAMGKESTATGEASVVMGQESTAGGNYSLAAGYRSRTEGGASVAIGAGTVTNGYAAVSLGQDTAANTNAVALGYKTKAEGKGATATGYGSEAYGEGSFAGGGHVSNSQVDGGKAYGESSFAFGTGAVAGSVSYAPEDTQQEHPIYGGNYTFAFGSNALASMDNAIALGSGAKAEHANSVAIGSNSVTVAENTISVGYAGGERRITNMAAGTADTDAATYGQVKGAFKNASLSGTTLTLTPIAGNATEIDLSSLAGGTGGDTVVGTTGEVTVTDGSGDNVGKKVIGLAESVKDNITALQTVVGDADSGLVKDVATIKGSDVMNSGITAEKVGGYDSHVGNGDIHVTAEQKTAWTNKQDKLTAGANITMGEGNVIALSKELTGLTGVETGTLTATGNVTVGGALGVTGALTGSTANFTGSVSGVSGTIDTTMGTNKNFVTGAAVYGAMYGAVGNAFTGAEGGKGLTYDGAKLVTNVPLTTTNNGTGADAFGDTEFVTKAWVMANAGGGTVDAYTKTETDTKLAGKADKATSLEGYGITDAYTKTETDIELAKKANITDVYTKAETDEKLAGKANAADVYSKADVYTKTEVDTALGNKANTADVYTKAETYSKTDVDGKLEAKANVTDVYTKTEVDGLVSEIAPVVTDEKTALGKGNQVAEGVVDTTVVGINNTVSNDKSTAVGNNINITGDNSVAMGTGHKIFGNNNGVFGDPTIITGDNSYSVGNNNYITASNTFVLGNDVGTEANPLTAGNSVVLGNKSFATVIPEIDGTNGVVSVGAGGAERRITNVRDGVLVSDAATVGQLDRTAGQLSSQIDSMGTRISKVGAGAAALAAMHPVYDEDCKLTFSAGLGAYRGEKAAAVGMFYRFSDRVMMNAGTAVGNDNNMFNIGLNFALDRHVGTKLPSKAVMARQLTAQNEKINTLTAENQSMKNRMAEQDAKIAKLMALIEEMVKKKG